MPPDVLLNGLAMTPHGGGVSTYIRELWRAYVEHPELLDGLSVQLRTGRTNGLSGPGVQSWPVPAGGVGRLGASFAGGRCRVFHGLDGVLPPHRLLPKGARTVVTVHDLSVFDLPDRGRVRTEAKRRALASSIRGADAVIAISHFTAGRIAHHFGRDDAEVIHLAAAPHFVPASDAEVAAVRLRYGLPAEYLLAVATRDGRKSTDLLAAVAARLDIPLVTIGAEVTQPVEDGAAAVRDLGFVPAVDLPALYSGARALLFLSTYEGFGLPPFEALACGTPVVSSPVGAVPELLPDEVTLCDLDVDSILEALGRVTPLAARAAGADCRVVAATTAERHGQLLAL